MTPHALSLLLAVSCSLIAAPALASQADNAQTAFSQAYQHYLSALEANENVQHAAKQAYTLGAKVYGEHSDNTANLAINYAKAISGVTNEDQAKRFALYNQAQQILARNHGKTAIETVDALFGMAHNTAKASLADHYFRAIIAIAVQQELPKLAADMQFAAASLLANKFIAEKYHRASSYLEQADAYYQANLPANAVERIKVDFFVASFAEGRKQYNEAISRLNHVVSVFDNNLNFDHSAELSAHSKLIHLYEKQGNSEQATKHCLAIAKMVPWKESQQQTPLYRVHPEYPNGKARQRRDGSVIMEFEVDTAGFVKNLNVLDSSGGVAFASAAKKAVAQWRYAPKFEHGVPVPAKTQVQLDFKIGQ